MLLAACSSNSDPGARPRSAPSSATPSPSATASPASDPTPAADPVCAPGAGRTVTPVADVVVPEVVVPAVAVDGEEVMAGFTVPEQVVEGGCVVRYDAPGGCLGAVTISAVTVPAATIPAGAVPEVELADGSVVGGREFPAVTAPAVVQPAVHSPQVCRVTADGALRGVTRAGVVREGFSRDGLARPGGVRPGRCDGDDCVAEVRVETVRLPPVRVPDVDVDPARLPTRALPGRRDVDVVRGGGVTSYVAPATALFGFDSAELTPAARTALSAIADRIRATAPRERLLVEGHTDDLGSAAHGLDLSRRRAEAVADWLVGEGFALSRIRTRGWGEASPVVPNTDEAGRARNRRVVITVSRS